MKINYSDKLLNKCLTEKLDKDKQTTDITGLIVTIRPSTSSENCYNNVFFKLKKMINSKRIMLEIGKYPAMSLSLARQKYLELVTKIENGERIQKVNTKKTSTFKELYEEWIVIKCNEITISTKKKYVSNYKVYLYTLENYCIEEFTPQFVMKWIESIKNTASNLTISTLVSTISNVIDYAVFKQEIPLNPIINISKYLPKVEYGHYNTFSDDNLESELTKLFNAFSTQDKQHQKLLYLYFFTLLRNTELRTCKWEQVIDGCLQVKTKTLDMFKVPLTTQAKQLLDTIDKDSEYIFKGRSKYSCLCEKTLANALFSLGYKDKFTVHSVRSCGRMYLQTVPDVKESIIELCLSHIVRGRIAQAYNRGEYVQERLKALQVWSDFICKCAGDNFTNLLKN